MGKITEQAIDNLYSDNIVGLKRSILMDMVGALLKAPRNMQSAELWKLHIDAALDQLDTAIYVPIIAEAGTRARINELEQLRPPEQYKGYALLMGAEQCSICGFNSEVFRRHIDDRIAALEAQLKKGDS